MVTSIPLSHRKRALRAFKQRGIAVHVGALEQLFASSQPLDPAALDAFLKNVFDLLSRSDGAVDGMLSKDLAASIATRLHRQSSRDDGDLTASLDVIDAFSVPRPRVQNPTTTSNATVAPRAPCIDAPAVAKSDLFRARYDLILSKTLRNDRFKPPLSGISSVSRRSAYYELTGVESLASRPGDRIVLGLLTQLEEGAWFLEDVHGAVRLDLSRASITAGLHTEGSFVIAQGALVNAETPDPVFCVSAMGTPPHEPRQSTVRALGKDANLFGGHFDVTDVPSDLVRMEKAAEDSFFLVLSDVHVNNSRVLAGVRHLLNGYLTDDAIPTLVVLMGDFLSHPFGQDVADMQALCDGFSQLGDMIRTEFKPLTESTSFIIIPSTNDAGPGNLLPRPPMPSLFTRGFVEAVGAERVHLASNPCRVRYLTQELVFMRDDILQKMVRHCSVKPDFGASGMLSEHFIKSIIDQAYLSPLPLSVRPVLWAHHQALSLFPTPHVVVVADRTDGFICKYGGTVGMNPGSFSTDFSFLVFLPADRRAQQCSLDSETVDKGRADSTAMEEDEVPSDAATPINVSDGEQKESDLHSQDDGQEAKGRSGDAEDEVESEEEEEEQVVVEDEEIESDRESDEEVDNTRNASSTVDSEEESDDDSILEPAQGVKKLDIKALLQSHFEDTSHAGPAADDSEDGDDEDRSERQDSIPSDGATSAENT